MRDGHVAAVTAEIVKDFITDRKVVSWSQLIDRFHTSKSTLRRRLQGSLLVTSLNMNRRRFTLKTILERHVDRSGVWHFNGATFSIHGGISPTVRHLAARGEAGWSEAEMETYLQVIPKKNLAELAGTSNIRRAKIGHKYVYLSNEEEKRRSQIQFRVKGEKPCGIKLDLEDFESTVGKVGIALRSIIRKILAEKGIKDVEERELEDILAAGLIRPLLHLNSDRQLARYLPNHPQCHSFYNFEKSLCIPTHSTISQARRTFGVVGHSLVFHKCSAWLLEALEVQELTVILDTSHAFKSEKNRWGLKIHLGAVAVGAAGLPIALSPMEDGEAHDLTTLQSMVDQVLSYGLPVRFIIGDGAYDAENFYYLCMLAEAEGISRYNRRRSPDTEMPDASVIEYLEEIREKQRMAKGRRRKGKLPARGIILSDPTIQADMLRRFPVTPWGSEERATIYNCRTIIERLFSIGKCCLGLDSLKTGSDAARAIGVYSTFISLLVVAMFAALLGIPQAMNRVTLLNL